MKTRILFLMLFIANYGFSQSVNDYKAVIIPMKYEFQKSENQYRMQTMTKANLIKAGFQAFYANESIPDEFNNRCSVLYLDVKQDNGLLVTKLFITFKDCNNALVFQSEIGKSREKEFQLAYADALNKAFESVIALGYSYNGGLNTATKSTLISQPAPVVATVPAVAVVPAVVIKNEVSQPANSESKISGVLYAQPTSYGYQLIDSEPKVVMKVYKTSNPASFMAKKGEVQGALVSKENQWFFEYYQNDKLVSEKVEVKF
jgi:hypothetical protein